MATLKKSYSVEGMTCSGCERAIQRVLTNVEGVKAAEASASGAVVHVEFDPVRVDAEQIKSAVGKLGYKVTGERAESA